MSWMVTLILMFDDCLWNTNVLQNVENIHDKKNISSLVFSLGPNCRMKIASRRDV